MLVRLRFQLACYAKLNRQIVLTFVLFVIVLPAPAGAQVGQIPALALTTGQLPSPLRDVALLGSDDFQIRCDASKRLFATPLQAHDWVYRARSSTDREIAHSACQLLVQIQNQLLANRARQYHSIRSTTSALIDSEKALFRISRIGGPQSSANLLAIVQYEPREELAFRAAVELMVSDRSPVLKEIDWVALRKSPRAASRSLGIWFSPNVSANAFHEFWQPLAHQIIGQYPDGDVLPEHVIAWTRESATRYRQLGLNDAADELTLQLISHLWNRPNDLVEMYDWLLRDDATDVLHHVNCLCADTILKDARLLLRKSEFQYRTGQWDQAGKTAAHAFNLIQGDSGKSIQLAIQLRSCGHERVAIQLLERLLENSETTDDMMLAAGRLLARYRHDQFDDSTAAAVLEDAIQQIQPTTKPVNRSFEVARKEAQVELAYYWHRHFVLQGNIKEATRHLVEGLHIAPDNCELLIAAWRFQGDAPDWTATIDELIEISLGKLEKLIQANTATRLADSREQHTLQHERVATLNSYAWLASQTERHLHEAETYARLALARRPDAPELMDTLASCLTARGQYQDAIALQRQAIRREPHNPTLQANLTRHQETQARLQSQATNR